MFLQFWQKTPPTYPYLLIHFFSVKRLEPGSSGKRCLPALGSWNHWGTEGTFHLGNNQIFVVEGTWRTGQRKQTEVRDPATPPETG